jgi:hypothetical protein
MVEYTCAMKMIYNIFEIAISLESMNEAIDLELCSRGKIQTIYGVPNVGKLHESVVQHLIPKHCNCDATKYRFKNGKSVGLIDDFMKCYSIDVPCKLFIIVWAGNGRVDFCD